MLSDKNRTKTLTASITCGTRVWEVIRKYFGVQNGLYTQNNFNFHSFIAAQEPCEGHYHGFPQQLLLILATYYYDGLDGSRSLTCPHGSTGPTCPTRDPLRSLIEAQSRPKI